MKLGNIYGNKRRVGSKMENPIYFKQNWLDFIVGGVFRSEKSYE